MAASELRDLPEDVIARAASEARKTCTHHGQIVPAIIKESAQSMQWRKVAAQARAPIERRIEEARWQPEPGELEEIKRQAAASLKAS